MKFVSVWEAFAVKTILSTKLYMPPPRAERVPRPRLAERLDASLGGRLTLVSAPAGFGKTTLVGDWLRTLDRAAAWLSLDEQDNDPARFLVYLTAALQRVDEHIGQGAQETAAAMSGDVPPAVEPLLTALINDIIIYTPEFVLVLDDYHLIHEAAVHSLVGFLLEHQPPGMHLMILTRRDPSLPLARLRVQGQMVEVRAGDLRFTQAEIITFFNEVMGLELSPAEIAVLESRTEGWVAGLQLAALSLHGYQTPANRSDFIQAFAGDDRHVMDYLVDEVVSRQPEDVQTFLLHTAVLDRLCGPLCDAVVHGEQTGQGQDLLEHLERANLFIVPLDNRREWYRYHHLFADLLRHRLRRVAPGEIAGLHGRASAWYEASGQIVDAVNHAIAADDIERVVGLVARNAYAITSQGELTALLQRLRALPDEDVRARPWLCIAYAWVLLYVGRLEQTEQHLQHAEAALSEGAPTASERFRIKGQVAAIRSCARAFAGDLESALVHAEEAMKHLPERDLVVRGFASTLRASSLRWVGRLRESAEAYIEAVALSRAAGDIHIAADSLCDLATLQVVRGRLHESAATCREALALVDEHIRDGGWRLVELGYPYTCMSVVLREWNDLEAAVQHARRGVELSMQWGQMHYLTMSYITLSQVLQASGDLDGALRAIGEAKQICVSVSEWYNTRVLAWEARLNLIQGNVAAAVRWVQESGLGIDAPLDFWFTPCYLSVVRVLMADGCCDEALHLIARLLAMAEPAGGTGYVIELSVLRALALGARGSEEQALVALRRALELAEPEAYVRVFVDEGEQLAHLLYEATARDIASAYAGRLLNAFPDAEPSAEVDTMVEPLSEREVEVLQLIAAGLSNREIAHKLLLSLNTVKSHTGNIYGKLGVSSRTQAVGKARMLGLLPSP
jgi:LuxR family maltose regulon positive regulatory protein